MNVAKVSNYLIAPCLHNLLEIIFVMLKDIDKDVNQSGEEFDKLVKSILKNMGEEVLNIDIKTCLSFMCKNIELGKPVIKAWILSWFNILLTIDELNLIQSLPTFYKDILTMVGNQKNEVNRAVEKFLGDLRSNFENSNYIKDRSFCIQILSSITQLFKLEFNRRRFLEIFKWIYAILKVQFSEMKSKKTTEKGDTPRYNSDDHQTQVSGNDIYFESICSEILLFILVCLKEEDDEIKENALKINNLL